MWKKNLKLRKLFKSHFRNTFIFMTLDTIVSNYKQYKLQSYKLQHIQKYTLNINGHLDL